MFLLEAVWILIQLSALAGGGVFFYNDYRHGWAKSKVLIRKAQRLIGKGPDDVGRADELVEEAGRRLDTARKRLASVQATYEQSLKKAAEQHRLAIEYNSVVDEAVKRSLGATDETVRKSFEETATIAAHAVTEHERRAELYEEAVRVAESCLPALESAVDKADAGYEITRTKADTVQIETEIAETEEATYGLVSDVERAGLTPKGEMDRLLDRSEHRRIKGSKLLDLVSNRGSDRLEIIIGDSRVQQILTEARSRLALPPGKTGDETKPKELLN